MNDQTCKNVRKAHVIHTFCCASQQSLAHSRQRKQRSGKTMMTKNKNQAPTHSSGPRGIEIPKRPTAFEFLHCARINSSGKILAHSTTPAGRSQLFVMRFSNCDTNGHQFAGLAGVSSERCLVMVALYAV